MDGIILAWQYLPRAGTLEGAYFDSFLRCVNNLYGSDAQRCSDGVAVTKVGPGIIAALLSHKRVRDSITLRGDATIPKTLSNSFFGPSLGVFEPSTLKSIKLLLQRVFPAVSYMDMSFKPIPSIHQPVAIILGEYYPFGYVRATFMLDDMVVSVCMYIVKTETNPLGLTVETCIEVWPHGASRQQDRCQSVNTSVVVALYRDKDPAKTYSQALWDSAGAWLCKHSQRISLRRRLVESDHLLSADHYEEHFKANDDGLRHKYYDAHSSSRSGAVTISSEWHPGRGTKLTVRSDVRVGPSTIARYERALIESREDTETWYCLKNHL